MRSEAEIQRAHRLLAAVVIDKAPMPLDDADVMLQDSLSAICWMLDDKHDGNSAFFSTLLSKIEDRLARIGWRFTQ